MRLALILILIPSLGLIACAEQAEQEGAAIEMAAMDMEALGAEISQIEAAWKNGYEAGDAAAVAGLYTEDALYLAPYTGATRGRAALQAQLAESMGMMSSRQITINRTDQGVSGDLSHGIGTYSVGMTMGGAPMTDSGKYLKLAKRGPDRSWKIYAHIWNTSQPQAEVAKMLSMRSPAVSHRRPTRPIGPEPEALNDDKYLY